MKSCCNIDRRGRLIRVGFGVLMVGNAAGLAWAGIPGNGWFSYMVQAFVALFGLFAIYEGAIGWCYLRALGFRTRF